MSEIEGRFQRIGKAVAKPGRGDELEQLLLEAAQGPAGNSGCELYLIARDPAEPDAVWVTEIWQSQAAAAAALQADGVAEQIAKVKEVVAEWGESHDLVPSGGLDVSETTPAATGYTRLTLDEIKDSAPDYGFAEIGEARFGFDQAGASHTGFGLHRLRPGKRHAFGHRHERAEEVYVILEGSGRIALDDEIQAVERHDVLRIGPEVTRAFEAGPDGLDILVFGPHHTRDGEMLPGWWPDEG